MIFHSYPQPIPSSHFFASFIVLAIFLNMKYAAITGLLASAASALPTTDSPLNLRPRADAPSGNISSFVDVPTSAELKWVPCYDRFKCANLEVPLDYEDPSAGTTVVAWIRQDQTNSSVPDLLFNPGGPGESGVDYILSGGGDEISELTGGKYNVVSFDPRGVNASGIDLTCFPGHPEVRDAFDAGSYSTSEEIYAQAVVVGKYCTAVNQNTTVRYGGTAAVVQDMMHFTELQATLNGGKAEEALIYYYGVSYGTVIGHTLAGMYPDRVGRIIVDANVDSAEHYNGTSNNSVEDADGTVEYFFEVCHEAGTKCAFAGNSTSPEEIKDRFNALLEKLEKEPVQASKPSALTPLIVTRDDLLNQVFNWIYFPAYYFETMAEGLAALEKRNDTAWFQILRASSSRSNPGPFNYTGAAKQEVLTLVTAVDAAGRYPIQNVDDYIKAVENIEATSVWFGEGYAGMNPLINAGMQIIPPKSQLFPGKSLSSPHRLSRTNNPHRLQEDQDPQPHSLRQQQRRPHHAHCRGAPHVYFLRGQRRRRTERGRPWRHKRQVVVHARPYAALPRDRRGS
jgi:pimeloyl-ACP methyl ester carboxylesterase